MRLLDKKALISLGIVTLLAPLIWVSFRGNKQTNPSPSPASTTVANQQKPAIVSTNPDPLENIIIPADQVIEITFNKAIENKDEFKYRIEPKTEVKIELSPDRKTVKIIPVTPYELGTTFTLFISTETKFDNKEKLEGEKIFHYNTIKYRGV